MKTEFSPKRARALAAKKRHQKKHTTVLLQKDLHAVILPLTNFGRSDGGDVITVAGAVNALIRYAIENADYKTIIQSSAK